MRLQQWSPNQTRNGITSEQKSTWYQGRTSKIIQTKSKFIRPNRNQLYSYVGPYRSLRYKQLEVSRTFRNDVGTSIIFITLTIPNLTGRSSAGALFNQHNTIAPRAHYCEKCTYLYWVSDSSNRKREWQECYNRCTYIVEQWYMAPVYDAPIAYTHAFSSSFSSIVKWRSSVQRGPVAVTVCWYADQS